MTHPTLLNHLHQIVQPEHLYQTAYLYESQCAINVVALESLVRARAALPPPALLAAESLLRRLAVPDVPPLLLDVFLVTASVDEVLMLVDVLGRMPIPPAQMAFTLERVPFGLRAGRVVLLDKPAKSSKGQITIEATIIFA